MTISRKNHKKTKNCSQKGVGKPNFEPTPDVIGVDPRRDKTGKQGWLLRTSVNASNKKWGGGGGGKPKQVHDTDKTRRMREGDRTGSKCATIQKASVKKPGMLRITKTRGGGGKGFKKPGHRFASPFSKRTMETSGLAGRLGG